MPATLPKHFLSRSVDITIILEVDYGIPVYINASIMLCKTQMQQLTLYDVAVKVPT